MVSSPLVSVAVAMLAAVVAVVIFVGDALGDVALVGVAANGCDMAVVLVMTSASSEPSMGPSTSMYAVDGLIIPSLSGPSPVASLPDIVLASLSAADTGADVEDACGVDMKDAATATAIGTEGTAPSVAPSWWIPPSTTGLAFSWSFPLSSLMFGRSGCRFRFLFLPPTSL